MGTNTEGYTIGYTWEDRAVTHVDSMRRRGSAGDGVRTTDLLAEIAARGNRTPVMPYETYEARLADLPGNEIVCGDGYRLSVIAGVGAYCTPRPDWFNGVRADYPGPYTELEVMIFEGDDPAGWEEYEAGGVYACVPVNVVRALIDAHGSGDPSPSGPASQLERGINAPSRDHTNGRSER